MFPEECAEDYYLQKMYDFANRFQISEKELFKTKRLKGRPELDFSRFIISKSGFVIMAEKFIEPPYHKLIADCVYYVASHKGMMIGCLNSYNYETDYEKVCQTGDSHSAKIYFSVEDYFRRKKVGIDLLCALINDPINEQSKIYAVYPLGSMQCLLEKFCFKDQENGIFSLDLSEEKPKGLKEVIKSHEKRIKTV